MATKESNLDKNFTDRGESYKAGMLLLIQHLTESDWKLGNKFSARLDSISKEIKTLYKDYENDLKDKNISYEAGYAQLENLISSYISILVFHTTLKNFFKSLCDAERCAVWKKGRETLDIPVFFVEGSDVNNPKSPKMVLSEKPIDDRKLLLAEYSQNDVLWFKLLPPWQQDFIKENMEKLSKQSIPSSLRSIPGLANLSMHRCQIDSVDVLSYFRHATQTPIDLMTNKQAGDEQFRLSCLNLASQIRLSLKEWFTSDTPNRQELVILTQSLLSPGWAATFKSMFLTDASDNDTLLYEMKERVVELFQRALSTPNAQIDAKDTKIKAIFFTEADQAKTLYYKNFLEKFNLMDDSDYFFKYKGSEPFKIILLSTNHPFNILRRFGTHSDQTKRNDTNTAGLLGAVSRYLSSLFPKIVRTYQPKWYLTLSKLISSLDSYANNRNSSTKKDKKKLIKILAEILDKNMREHFDKKTIRLFDALQTLLSIPIAQGVLATDNRHYQMQISSAEAIVLHCIKGILWVACKSGKDRTGGASIAYDATTTFDELKGRHPRHDDGKEDRALYLKLLKRFIESGHQQRVASENAPGAEGLVKSTYFFPSDLQLDPKTIQLQTKMARLNKLKIANNSNEKLLNYRILNKDLQDIKNRTTNITLGQTSTLPDWQRNWEIYFINNKSVKELRNNKEFKDKNDLSEFMETHLLAQIESRELREYYKSLFIHSFHQGGFPHFFAKLSFELLAKHYQQSPNKAIPVQPDMSINFSWSKEKGIQIEEINIYKEKKVISTDEVLLPENGEYHCQTQSCILLKLSEVKDRGYKLAVSIQSAKVDCADELKPIFFKRPNLLEAFIHYLQSLLAAIKRHFDRLLKSGPVLNESWLSEANPGFFKKSTVNTEHEESQIQAQPQPPPVPSLSNNK